MIDTIDIKGSSLRPGDKIIQAVGTVYIRGLAFKARAGGRRQMVLLQLKKRDESNTDLWLLKYLSVLALGILAGAVVATIWPLA